MCVRERESKRGSEKERRKRGIWEGEESRLRVVKNEPTGETFFLQAVKTGGKGGNRGNVLCLSTAHKPSVLWMESGS